MKYLKMLGLAAIAAGALMAFSVGSALATTLDCSPSTMCTAPTTIHAVNEGHITLDSAIKITCKESTVHGTASTGTDASGETPNGAIETLTFTNCEGWTITVLKKGSLEIHTDPESSSTTGNGTLTSKGAEVTVEGFGLHCIYGTAATGDDIGTVTGSSTTGATAVFHINARIRLLGGRSGAFCGGSTAEWTGTYKITTPDYLDVT